jgi:membrane-associated protease RseP (regulator of RpoE activity)
VKAFAVICLVLAPGSGLRGDTVAAPTSVPFELLKTRHIVVSIKINGRGPYRVIFDTGAPFNLINNRVARDSGMIAKDSRPPLFGFLAAGGPTKIQTLELGGLKVENTQAVVMDHPTVELMSKFVSPVEGIIGYPFFARYRMTLDYQARRLTFVPNGYDPPDALESLMNALMTVADDRPLPKRVLAPAAQWGLVLRSSPNDSSGVLIDRVVPDTPAATAGLQVGDRILTLDDRWTDSVADAYAAASDVKAGSTVTLHVKRGDKEIDIKVTPRNGL